MIQAQAPGSMEGHTSRAPELILGASLHTRVEFITVGGVFSRGAGLT